MVMYVLSDGVGDNQGEPATGNGGGEGRNYKRDHTAELSPTNKLTINRVFVLSLWLIRDVGMYQIMESTSPDGTWGCGRCLLPGGDNP